VQTFDPLCMYSNLYTKHESILVNYIMLSAVNKLQLLQPFYGSLNFVRDNPGKPVPEETFTHSHLSWLSIIPYLLPPSFMIHGILLVQFTCLTVFFHNLSPSCLWSTSWLGLTPSTSHSIHFLTQSLSSFRRTCSHHHNLICCSTKIMPSNPSLLLMKTKQKRKSNLKYFLE